jgi:hypothetical protein
MAESLRKVLLLVDINLLRRDWFSNQQEQILALTASWVRRQKRAGQSGVLAASEVFGNSAGLSRALNYAKRSRRAMIPNLTVEGSERLAVSDRRAQDEDEWARATFRDARWNYFELPEEPRLRK